MILRRVLIAGSIALGMLGMVAGPADAAPATGSVPSEVAAYVASPHLVQRLDEVYGENAAGAGVDFDDSTKPGAITRVYGWSPDRLAGTSTDHPIRMTNQWITPISIADKPVGFATIWINPESVTAELASFDMGTDLVEALADVPASAAVVRDDATGAWFAVADDTATPLIVGKSGVTSPVPVDSLKLTAPKPASDSEPDASGGFGIAVGGIAVLAVITTAFLVPTLRASRRRAP